MKIYQDSMGMTLAKVPNDREMKLERTTSVNRHGPEVRQGTTHPSSKILTLLF